MNARASTVKVSYNWHLRMRMAERGMFASTSDLVPLLAEHGVVLSREQVYRLVAKVPERVSLTVLAALCDALGESPSELVEPVRAERKAEPSRASVGPGRGAGHPSRPGPGGPDGVTPGHQQAWRDLVSHRVAEAGGGLSAVQVSSAIDAAAPNTKALSVLARALERGPGALLVEARPVIGELVCDCGPQGQARPRPVCARCGHSHPKLTASDVGGLCRPCRNRYTATACARCGVVKPVAGRGPVGEPLSAVCVPRPKRPCSRCGRERKIARRAHAGQGELCDSCFQGPLATCAVCGRERPCNFVAAGRPVCMTCSPKRLSRCAHCGKDQQACFHALARGASVRAVLPGRPVPTGDL